MSFWFFPTVVGGRNDSSFRGGAAFLLGENIRDLPSQQRRPGIRDTMGRRRGRVRSKV